MTGLGIQSFVAVVVVLGLVVALAWLLRRGAFGPLRAGSRAIAVETAVPLGERRSLVIVSVEGRRLLLGMTPAQISMVTELDAVPPAAEPPAAPGDKAPSFEQLLVARAKDMFSRRNHPSTGQSNASIVEMPSPFGDQPATPLRSLSLTGIALAGRQYLLARFARLARYAVGQGAHDYRLCPHNGLSVQES